MIKARVKQIQSSINLHIVKFEFLDQDLTMMSLELDSKIKIGIEVMLNIKPSHVALSNTMVDTTHSNVLKSTIKHIDNGELLSYVVLDIGGNFKIDSIITLQSSKRLQLEKEKEVFALFKASEISIAKVLL